MPTEGLKPFNSNPFFRITDFAVPIRGIVLGLAEFDEDEDLAYLYKADGTFVESRPGVPRDGGEIGWYNHTIFAKVGPDIFSVDGGQSNFLLYKNGVGFSGGSNTGTVWLSSHGSTLWTIRASNKVDSYDAKTGAALNTKSLTWTTTRHRTNGTHHVYTYFRGNTQAPDWRLRHILAGENFTNEIVLLEMQETSDPITPIYFSDVAINSDRVAVTAYNWQSNITTIKIFDLAGNLKDTLTNGGDAQMLLMSEEKLYASAAMTPYVSMWDITEDQFGEKIYTPAGSFQTPAPYCWYGNLAT